MILTPLQKLTKNVEDSGKLIVAKCFEKLSCPKSNKLPNLVTLDSQNTKCVKKLRNKLAGVLEC